MQNGGIGVDSSKEWICKEDEVIVELLSDKAVCA